MWGRNVKGGGMWSWEAYCRWNVQQFCRHPRVCCRDEGLPPTEGGGRGIWWARPSAYAYAPASGPSAIDIDQSIETINRHISTLCYTVNVELCLARTATRRATPGSGLLIINRENFREKNFCSGERRARWCPF